MSLINDALKKAQKQRTGEAPSLGSMPSIGGSSPRQIASRGKSGGGNTALIGGGIAVAVLVIGGGAWFALSGKPAANPAPQPVAATPAPPAPTPAASNPAPTFTLQTSPRTEPAAPVVTKSEPPPAATPAVSAPATAATPAPQPPAPAAPARPLDPVAIQYLDNIKVAGIRASTTDSKVLMNDRVYRIGSVVNGEMGIRLVGITANSLTFEDAAGGRYTRTF